MAWQRERHHDQIEQLEAYFDPIAFEDELAGLPGAYAPPGGCLLLALADGRPAGCVGLRALDAGRCEMKRMFVDPGLQGRGIGRALADAVVDEARALGYDAIALDTGVRQTEARGLYGRLGFTETVPPAPLPAELVPWLVFMELPLRG